MGGYDSWYLRAVHPTDPVGLWIRHTFHDDGPGGVRGARWITLFEPEGVTAAKESIEGKPAVTAERFSGEAGDARWDLQAEAVAAPFEHFPAQWMYRRRFPKTKPVSVAPLARVSGTATLGARCLTLDGWPGMVGHNWGAEHAHRWIWLHVAGFDGAPDSWLDVTLARLKLGPVVTPWLSNGALELDGERRRLGGPFRRPRVKETAGSAEIAVAGAGVSLDIEVAAPGPDAIVYWRYADPDGGRHVVANCSIARLKLTVRRTGASSRVLISAHRAAYELGMRDAPAGCPVQPFADP